MTDVETDESVQIVVRLWRGCVEEIGIGGDAPPIQVTVADTGTGTVEKYAERGGREVRVEMEGGWVRNVRGDPGIPHMEVRIEDYDVGTIAVWEGENGSFNEREEDEEEGSED